MTTIAFNAGWNLLSSFGYTNTVNDLFGDDINKISEIFTYDTVNKKYILVNNSDPLVQGLGYWYRITQSFSKIIVGDSFTSNVSISFYQGWNLISVPFNNEFINLE